MADASVRSLPTLALPLIAETGEHRRKLLDQTHPEYRTHRASWALLLDAFEGAGGFLDGEYLWPFPREAPGNFDKRRKMARYHNYVETLVDLYVRFIFTQGVRRTSEDKDYNAWLENTNGSGLGMNDLLKQLTAQGLVTGHAAVLIDKTSEAPTGPSRADERAKVVASIFASTAIPDWRFDRDRLIGVKLYEVAPAPVLTAPMPESPEDARQFLLWSDEGWARFDAKGDLLAADTPQLGLVPLVGLRPKPSQISLMRGRSIVGNAKVVQALFNRASEEDQVLRDQSFSILTVKVHPEADVEQAKTDLGSDIGTTKALVAKGEISYVAPDQSVPGTVRENIAYLVQELFRAAHVRFRRDHGQAESGESIRLQYAELNEALQGLAKSLAAAEKQIARAWFAWQYPTFEAAEAAFVKASPECSYPDEFFNDSLINDLAAWAESLRMGLGKTMQDRIKKRAVRRIDPSTPAAVLADIDAEIEAMADTPALMTTFPLDTGNEDGA